MRKQVIAALLAICLCAGMLVGCGGSTSTASGNAPAAAAPAEGAEGKVINIYSWNDEFRQRVEAVYDQVDHTSDDATVTYLKDGCEIHWIVNPNQDGVYQQKLDEALLNQGSADADSKIDLFLSETDYVNKYTDAEADVADAIAVTGGKAAIVSGGNNILETGDATVTADATDVTLEKGSAYATVFGTNVLTDGVLVPVYKATGALADALATTVAKWGVEGVDLTVDQNGTVRGATVPGAVKADIKDAISSVEVADKADDAYYYTLSGIRVATPQKGIFIKNGKKVIIK